MRTLCVEHDKFESDEMLVFWWLFAKINRVHNEKILEKLDRTRLSCRQQYTWLWKRIMRKIDWLNVIMCYALQFLHANFLRMQKSYQLDVCHDLTHQHNQERFEIESGLNSEPLRLSIRTKRFYQFREDLWLNLSMQPRQVYASNRDKTVNDHELIGATKELTRGSS